MSYHVCKDCINDLGSSGAGGGWDVKQYGTWYRTISTGT